LGDRMFGKAGSQILVLNCRHSDRKFHLGIFRIGDTTLPWGSVITY